MSFLQYDVYGHVTLFVTLDILLLPYSSLCINIYLYSIYICQQTLKLGEIMKIKKISLLVMAATFSSNLLADSLLQIYELAKKTDPKYLNSALEIEASDIRIDKSMASFLPHVNLSKSYSESDQDYDEASSLSYGNDKVDNKSKTLSISLTQSIYNNKNFIDLRQSEKRKVQSYHSHVDQTESLIIRTSELYFNALAALDNVEFSKAEVRSVKKQLSQTKEKFEVGLIAKTDVDEAQATRDIAIADQISAENDLENAYEDLKELTGRYHYKLLGLMRDINFRNPSPEDVISWGKSSVNSAEVRIAVINLDIAKDGISMSRSDHLPTVELNARYIESDIDSESFSNSLVSDVNSISDTSEISIDFNLPLYSGGYTSASVNESINKYQQEHKTLDGVLRAAINKSRRAYLGVVSSVSSVNALDQSVVSRESALKSTNDGFEAGTRTIVDVLEQTQLLYDVKRKSSRKRYDYIMNTLKLKQSVGSLTVDDLIKVNSLLR